MPLKIPPKKPVAGKPLIPAKKPLQASTSKPISTASPSVAGDGFAKARNLNDERQREIDARKNRPPSFRMDVGEGGQKGVSIVLTDTAKMPGMPFFHYMHHWGFDEGKPQTDFCIQDDPQGCPRCKELGRKGGWEMVLTCIDTRPFTYKKGPKAGQKITGKQRKIVEVKTQMIPKFERLYKTHKTFRGMVIRLFRDNAKDASIGSSVEFVKMLTEAELKKWCENKPDLFNPVDYKAAFPRPTYEEYVARLGGDNGAVGSEDVADESIPF